MPELPEVETVRRALIHRVQGHRITDIRVVKKTYIRQGYDLIPHLVGQEIQTIERRGKLIALFLLNGWVLLHHLGMTGRLLLASTDSPLEKHTHLCLGLDQGQNELRQWDPRRFGYVALLHQEELAHFSSWSTLGTDPFDLKAKDLFSSLQNRRQPIKSFLLDQRKIAGLGNIYADESLFRARIHPLRSAGELTLDEVRGLLRCIRKVLREAIAAGGSSTSDFQKLDGTLGEFQHRHRVYRRTGLPCKRCKSRIEKTIIGGRSSHFCPVCQPKK